MDPTTNRTRPAPRSHGQSVGAPVFASVAGGTDTPGDAPLVAELELDEPDEADALAGTAPLGRPEGTTWKGAENRWGLVKSCWFEKRPSTH